MTRKGRVFEYEDMSHSQSIEYARDEFLSAVERLAPEVLRALGEEPFRLYKLYRKSLPESWTDLEIQTVDYDPEIAAFQKSLFDWSTTNHLNAGWCRQRAYSTLNKWYFVKEQTPEKLGWQKLIEMRETFVTRDDLRFIFHYQIPDPIFTSFQDIREQMREAFKEQMETHLDGLKLKAEAAGFIPSAKTILPRHFEWLVRYQIKGESQIKIEKDVGQVRQAVSAAVKSVASFIELPLRKSPRGRPPGIKETFGRWRARKT